MDIGATRCICDNGVIHQTTMSYTWDFGRWYLYMGSSNLSKVQGKCMISLKFTKVKDPILYDVLHVTSIHHNSMPELLSMKGFKLMILVSLYYVKMLYMLALATWPMAYII